MVNIGLSYEIKDGDLIIRLLDNESCYFQSRELDSVHIPLKDLKEAIEKCDEDQSR
jgi:hypothetical protein